MKRALTIGALLLIVWVGWQWMDVDRLFADVYYAKVPSLGTVEQSDMYTYEVIAYDENGKKRPLTLQAPGQLSEGDFLKVYVKDDRRVTAYEQVTESAVPSQLKDEQVEESNTIPLP